MSSPIGFREFSEDNYNKFIPTLSDEELIKAGKAPYFVRRCRYYAAVACAKRADVSSASTLLSPHPVVVETGSMFRSDLRLIRELFSRTESIRHPSCCVTARAICGELLRQTGTRSILPKEQRYFVRPHFACLGQFENLILFWSRGIHKASSLKASSHFFQKAINLSG